jgi:hypothetical protein
MISSGDGTEPNAATLTIVGTGSAMKLKVSVAHVNKTSIDSTAWSVEKHIDA